MNEKTKHETVKHKDADPARDEDQELDEGLDETFPASDPVSATRAPKQRKDKPEAPTRPPRNGGK